MLKLDIGSGGKAADYLGEGWTGVDPYADGADIKADMWSLPFEDNTVDEIFTSHALEHIGKRYVLPTIIEWKRVLKSGGKVTIRVPDLEWCVKHWLRHKDHTGWNLDIIFGNQNHDGEYHKTGFTMNTLSRYATEAGLKIIKAERIHTHSQETLSIECVKL